MGSGVVPPTAALMKAAEARREKAGPAIAALRAGSFEDARRTSEEILRSDGDQPEARFVRAVARYRARIDQMGMDIRTVVVGAITTGRINTVYLRQALEATAAELAGVDDDLGVAAGAPYFELELCPACWRSDWNQSGEIDEGDEHLLEVETDREGHPLPSGDPRRRPTFTFDRGDLFWARALLSHQRALIDLFLAFEPEDLSSFFHGHSDELEIRVKVADAARVSSAKRLFLQGLSLAERARQEYLVETDDHQEWVPNPRQKDHAVPLEVDEALYAKWGLVLEDLRKLIEGEEGVDLAALARAQRVDEAHVPQGFIDVGRWLRDPADFVIRLNRHGQPDTEIPRILGPSWRQSMKASQLPSRIEGLQGTPLSGEFLEKKLKYLLWLN